MKESAVASHVRLEAARLGIEIWRNNIGVLLDQTGRPVRYGLCNDSAALNKKIKSSDYIGITPVMIMPHHVGRVLGVFTAVETKESDWTFRPGDERAIAQACYHDIVKRVGGFAGFACNVGDFRRIIGR